MKITLSVIKADIGSIAGHIRPSIGLMEAVRGYVEKEKNKIIRDYYISSTGDDVAILLSHQEGVGSSAVHKLAWDAFICGTEKAKEQGLYGAGQDLLNDAFSGNVKEWGRRARRWNLQKGKRNRSFCSPRTKRTRERITCRFTWVSPIRCTVPA